MKDSILSFFLLLIVTIVLPIFIFFDVNTYFEFLFMSIFVRLVLVFLTPKNHSVLINNFLNLAQGVYLIIILMMWSRAHNDFGVFDISKLFGDSISYFSESLMMYDEREKSFVELGELSSINYFLFQYILSKVYYFTTSKYLSALLFVVFTGLLNLLILFKTGILLNFKKQTMKIIGVFYIIFPHVLASNTNLLKDSLLVFSFLLLIYSAICMVKKKYKNYFKLSVYLVLSLFLCAFIRLPFVILFIIIFYFIVVKKSTNLRNGIIFSLFVFYIMTSFLSSQVDDVIKTANQIEIGLRSGEVYGSGVTSLLVGSYTSDPFYLKIIKLPLVVIVQYLNPINIFTFSHSNPWSYIDINLKIIWLLFIGPLYIFCCTQLKSLTPLLKKLLIVSVIGYVLIAYLETGIVPRYALSFMCLSVLPLAYIFQEMKRNLLLKKKYIYFNRIYFFVAFILVFIYIIR